MHFRFCAAACVFVSMGLASDVRVVEEIVAKVNSDIITKGDIEDTRRQIETELKGQGVDNKSLDKALKERSADALRDQIDQLLLVQHGKDLNINVDSEVTKRIGQIQIETANAGRCPDCTDPDKFHEWIHEQTGKTFEDFKQQIKNQILTQRVIGQEVMSRINVPSGDVQKYYEEHKAEFVREEQIFLREILISTEGKTPDQVAQAEKRAKDIVVRARKGERFGELAKQYSDAETKDNFGELPPYKRGQLKKEIEDIVFKAKKGYVTDPVRMANGFEILRVEDRYEAGQAPFEEVENDIREKISMPRMQPKVRELLTKLREDAFLQIKTGYVDSGAAPGKDTSWKDPAQLKPQTTTKEEVASHKHRKRLLWVMPIPGTSNAPKKTETAQKQKPGEKPAETSSTTPPSGSADRPAGSPAPQPPPQQ